MPMTHDFIAFLVSSLFLLGLIGFGEFIRAKFFIPSENIRRVIHFITGLFVVISPYIFESVFWIYVLGSIFTIANVIAIHQNWFKGMHDIGRKSYGTALFPLALLFALWLTKSHILFETRAYIFQIAFLILAIADPMASLVGTRVRNPIKFTILGHIKTVQGALAFFICAFLVSFIGLNLWTSWASSAVLLLALLLAAITTLTELLGGKGWDNFFIVLSSVTLLHFVHQQDNSLNYIGGATLAALAFSYVSYRLHFLSLSGAIATCLLAISVLGLGGWQWALPAIAFFVLSSLLSKWGKSNKSLTEIGYAKGSRRDAFQVLANGGVAWICLIANTFFPSPIWYLGFCGAFAAACADTWATEIGGYFRQPTFSIRTGKAVLPGTNGGISISGTIGSILGATLIAFCTALYAPNAFLMILCAGFLAALFDSLLGATLQGIYQDENGVETEKAAPHRPLIRGYSWLNNDAVNLAANTLGALIALLGNKLF